MSVTRWRRFGHDRAYAVLADGTKLGFRDLRTGIDHPEAPQHAPLLAAAIEHWEGTEQVSTEAVRQEERPPADVTRPASRAPQWVDLAQNRPGALVRAQAIDEWERRKSARPVMSRVGRLLSIHTDERAWRVGAEGEKAVGSRLERLAAKDPRWRVLHAVPVGSRGSDIDHVAIGPAGVLTINAKHHDNGKVWIGGDTVMVNGHRQPYVRNSRHEAARASRLLSEACGFEVAAVGVVALVGVVEIRTKAAPVDVRVVRRKDLARWMRKQPQVLGEEQIERIYAEARRSSTWIPA